MAVSSFCFKIASRCNLNCSYCYVYNKGDSSWRDRPSIMPDAIYEAAIGRVREYCHAHGKQTVTIVFHGGEPTLAGVQRLRRWSDIAFEQLAGLSVSLSMQTNGVLINEEWARFCHEYNIFVGLSVDGPAHIHDRHRLDHLGRGSFSRVENAARLLVSHNVRFGILSVVQLGADPLACHNALVALGSRSIAYMLPHYTHDTIAPVFAKFGPTPCADFLLPILDYWWHHQQEDIRIRELWNIGRVIMGGYSRGDTIGNDAFGYLFVESDGAIEGLDILRVCDGPLYATGLNVDTHGFDEVISASTIHSQLLAGTFPAPRACGMCPEADTCAGGYLPHRYAKASGFDNPSVWCADLLALFTRMRELLGVSYTETARLRKEVLGAISGIHD